MATDSQFSAVKIVTRAGFMAPTFECMMLLVHSEHISINQSTLSRTQAPMSLYVRICIKNYM